MKTKYKKNVSTRKFGRGDIKSKRKSSFGLNKTLLCGLLGIFIFFSVFYLLQVIDESVIGFEKQKLESKIIELQKGNTDLQAQVAGLDEINKVASLGMVKADNIEYIKVSGSSDMAMAR